MVLFGSNWKEDVEDDGPLFGRHWKDEIPNHCDHTSPSIYDMLNQMTNEERLSVFNCYCKYCGSKDSKCQCWNDE